MSILKVDTINEKTSGNGVAIPGHVIQVVQYADSTNYTTSSTSAVQASQTGTFTLKNSSNKVLVTVNCLARAARSSASGVRLAIYRGSIASGTKITSGTEPQVYTTDSGTEQYSMNTLQFLDTPSAASTTYSLGFYKHSSSGDVTIYGAFFNTIIILQEVAV